MISSILSAIRNALAASVRALAAWGDDLLSLPWHLKQMLYGPDPVGPAHTEVEADGVEAVGPIAQRHEMVERGLLPLDLEPARGGVDPLGQIVWLYACNPATRSRADLSKLSPDQQAWLMSMSEPDLDKLAVAGSRACSKLVRGQRTSAVSMTLSPCGKGDSSRAIVVPIAEDASPSFAERVQRIAVSRKVDRGMAPSPAFV